MPGFNSSALYVLHGSMSGFLHVLQFPHTVQGHKHVWRLELSPIKVCVVRTIQGVYLAQDPAPSMNLE